MGFTTLWMKCSLVKVSLEEVLCHRVYHQAVCSCAVLIEWNHWDPATFQLVQKIMGVCGMVSANPFPAAACKISRLESAHTHACKQYIWWFCNKSALDTVLFGRNPFYNVLMQRGKKASMTSDLALLLVKHGSEMVNPTDTLIVVKATTLLYSQLLSKQHLSNCIWQ